VLTEVGHECHADAEDREQVADRLHDGSLVGEADTRLSTSRSRALLTTVNAKAA